MCIGLLNSGRRFFGRKAERNAAPMKQVSLLLFVINAWMGCAKTPFNFCDIGRLARRRKHGVTEMYGFNKILNLKVGCKAHKNDF